MPSFVNSPGTIGLAAIWTIDSQRVENTFHYHVGAAINSTLLNAMATTYATWAGGHATLWSTQASLTEIYLRDLTTQFSSTLEFIPTSPVQGTDAAHPFPNNVAFAVKRQSGLAGRKNRGRVFHFGITEDMVGAVNNAGTTFANNVVAAYNALMASQLSGNAATEVILHKNDGTTTNVLGYSYSDLTLDSQRRRLPGHNIHH